MTTEDRVVLLKRRIKFATIFSLVNLVFFYLSGLEIIIKALNKIEVEPMAAISVAANYLVYRYLLWGKTNDLKELQEIEGDKSDGNS